MATGRDMHTGPPASTGAAPGSGSPPTRDAVDATRAAAVITRPGCVDAYADEATAALFAHHFDPAFGRRFAERALDALVVVRGARVLDVPCGTGVFARMAAHVVGASGMVVGLDPEPAAIEAARRIDVTSIVEWRRWDGARLPFGDGAFDVVACQHALHRLAEPAAALEEMRRVLVPGGRLGITVWGPIEENPAFAAQLDAVVRAGLDDAPVVERLLDAFAFHRLEDLRTLAEGAGFTDASCRSVRILAALPRVSQWVHVYPSLPPLSGAWSRCGPDARSQFLSRATELLRPFEHEGVLRVQASARLVVARAPLA